MLGVLTFAASAANDLPVELRAKLNDARGPGRGNPSKSTITEKATRSSELRVIESVKHIGTYLDPHVLADARPSPPTGSSC